MSGPVLLTVGHGTLPAERFAAVLRDGGVRRLVDIRRFPASRRHPHFARDRIGQWLPRAGIAYRWEEALGGRRGRLPDSPNTGLRNAAFAGYADYMRTPAFWAALEGVLADADQQVTAVMCAESVWWRCHRRLVADAATLARGWTVDHLGHDGRRQRHEPTDVARVQGGLLVYDGDATPTLPGL